MLNWLLEKLFPFNFALLHMKTCPQGWPASLICWELQRSPHSQRNTFKKWLVWYKVRFRVPAKLPWTFSFTSMQRLFPLSSLSLTVILSSDCLQEYLYLFAPSVSSSVLFLFTSLRLCYVPLWLCFYFCKALWTQFTYKILDKRDHISWSLGLLWIHSCYE